MSSTSMIIMALTFDLKWWFSVASDMRKGVSVVFVRFW
jgi:hypothetical protein